MGRAVAAAGRPESGVGGDGPNAISDLLEADVEVPQGQGEEDQLVPESNGAGPCDVLDREVPRVLDGRQRIGVRPGSRGTAMSRSCPCSQEQSAMSFGILEWFFSFSYLQLSRHLLPNRTHRKRDNRKSILDAWAM